MLASRVERLSVICTVAVGDLWPARLDRVRRVCGHGLSLQLHTDLVLFADVSPSALLSEAIDRSEDSRESVVCAAGLGA